MSETTPTPEQQPNQPVPQPPEQGLQWPDPVPHFEPRFVVQPQIVVPQKDIGVAYLWWLFFGIVGAHKFYIGRPGLGVAYLLTLGFLLIGPIVDLFTLPSQVRRRNAELRAEVTR